MYKVLLVEDEDVIRKGLLFSVDWVGLECEIIAECTNGKEGVDKILELNPDIVITDITMPIMDGIEMIRDTYEHVEYACIIISGYSNFEYAQSAIKYGVLGYLLKPIDKTELVDVIGRAKEECDNRKKLNENRISMEELANRFYKEKKSSYQGDDVLVKQMLKFVEDKYSLKISMHDLQDELHYSDTFLNKKFKAAVGTTFMEYVNQYRIRKAIELMNAGDDSIQDIAWKCGIGEYKYFAVVFKKYLGYSPKDFLKEVNQKQNRT